MKSDNTVLKGFRDILPQNKKYRDLVENTLIKEFEKFNFLGIETPTIEYSSLLLGKYGDEADKLVYKFTDNGARAVALRYDQTVPTARYIVNNQNELPKFFRRYQIQNVFRSEKPQKGRYREFKQCDIDIYGCNNPLADAEIVSCVYNCFKALGINDFEIKINDRQVLVDTIKSEAPEINEFSIISSLDKLDKKTEEEVIKELTDKGLSLSKIQNIISKLRNSLVPKSLKNIMELSINLGVKPTCIKFDPFLARGLDYYTSFIMEVKSDKFKNGSLGGGGRYDNLINNLVGKNVPAVGFSFGFDRIVEYLQQQNVSIEKKADTYLVSTFNDDSLGYALKVANELRRKGNCSVEIYVNSSDTLSNQLKYAIKNNFNYFVVAGANELKNNEYVIKNLKNKETTKCGFAS